MGADTAVIVEAVNVSGLGVKDDAQHTLQLVETEVAPEEIVHATLHELASDVLNIGAQAGGGVRVFPPKLMPVGIESKAQRQEATAFMEDCVGITTPAPAALKPKPKPEGSPTRRGLGAGSEADLQRNPSLANMLLKRRSTRELIEVRPDGSPEGDKRRLPVQLQRTSSVSDHSGHPASPEPPPRPPQRRPRPPRPDGPPRAKVLKSSHDALEGWDGGGGVRIAPGLLTLVGGPRDPRAPARTPPEGVAPQDAAGGATPSPPASPPDRYIQKQGRVHHAADFMPDFANPPISWVDADSDDEAAYDVPHNIPAGVLRTLRAQDQRLHGRGDAVQLAKELVDQYARANGKIPLYDTLGDASSAHVERKRVVAHDLTNAVDAISKARRTTGKMKRPGSEGLQPDLIRAIAQLEAEIAAIDTALLPCCTCCHKMRCGGGYGSSKPIAPLATRTLTKRQRTKVAPAPDEDVRDTRQPSAKHSSNAQRTHSASVVPQQPTFARRAAPQLSPQVSTKAPGMGSSSRIAPKMPAGAPPTRARLLDSIMGD